MSEIDTLQTTLPTALCKPLPQIPVIKPEEVPERKLEYTKESLLAFKEELRAKEEAERQAAATGADGGFFGGFGGDGGDVYVSAGTSSDGAGGVVSVVRGDNSQHFNFVEFVLSTNCFLLVLVDTSWSRSHDKHVFCVE